MPKNYFHCKQFTVHQDKTAMKVCTDSCLFGAWAACYVHNNNQPFTRILDVGTGTGLLSLMLAQKSEATIDAVETDEQAAAQAANNFLQSPWKERLHCFKKRIQDFSSTEKYDFIVCNPPFYENDLKSENKTKNIAHHNAGLTLSELMLVIIRLLKDNGSFAVLLPYHRTNEWQTIAANAGYCLQEQVLIKQTVNHFYFRSINLFSNGNTSFIQNEISIKDANEKYTNEFVCLLKDYYLHL